MKSPFVYHDGQWYLCPTFNHRASKRLLTKTLATLLERYPPGDILLLRPMSPSEVRLLESYRDDFDAEAFARMCCTEEKRLGKPRARRGREEP